MKIAFLTSHDSRDLRTWSGTLLHMHRSLSRHAGEVTSLGPARQKLELASKAVAKALKILSGYNVDATHTVMLSKALARTFKRRLAAANFDVIFAPVAATELAYLDTELPVVYYGDLTARLFRDYAANVAGLSKWSLKQLELIEQRALARANHLVYGSQWAAESAVSDYGVPRDKVSVVPMGANIDGIPTVEEITSRRSHGSSGDYRLLFVGVDWERKGGNLALDTLIELRNRGVDASLTVVGCIPPRGRTHPQMQVIRFLNKSVPGERLQFYDLLRGSDFMLFPTRKDASPIVCAEANAFGLPLIASDVGGLAVRNGENGILLPADASGNDYADTIQGLVNDHSRYFALAQSGRAAYDSRLNWDAWGRAIASILRTVAAKGTRL